MVRLEITGTKEVQNNLIRLQRKYKGAFDNAIKQEAKELLSATIPRVPVLTGAMRDSGRVARDENDVVVIFGGIGKTSRYTIVQHERLDFNHPRGGEAKFLERTFTERLPNLMGRVSEKIRREVK